MQLETVIARAFRGRWTQVLAGVIAAAVLIPVPALAFSWIGPTGTFLDWSSNATYTLTGGAPQPTIVPFPGTGTFPNQTGGTFDTAMGGSLEIDMHAYNPAPGANAKAEISTFRDFSTSAGGQTFSVSQGFSTILQNATLHVAVSVIKLSNNQNAFQIPQVNDSAGFNQQTFAEFMTNSGFLKQDFYRVIVDISYTQATQNPSFWNNVSHHKFNFSAM